MAVFDHLASLAELHGDVLPRSSLTAGVDFDGQRLRLLGPQGIFKPSQFSLPLSITTVPPVPGREPPYPDRAEGDLLRYSYRGTDPQHRDKSDCAGPCSARCHSCTSWESSLVSTSRPGRSSSWRTILHACISPSRSKRPRPVTTWLWRRGSAPVRPSLRATSAASTGVSRTRPAGLSTRLRNVPAAARGIARRGAHPSGHG